MSLIKKEVKTQTTKTAFRIPLELFDRLEQYSQFLSSSRDHVVTQALTYVISKDSDFVRHLADKTGDRVVDKSVDKKVNGAGGVSR